MTALRSKNGLVYGDTNPAIDAAKNAVQMAETLKTDQNLLGQALFWQAIAQYYDSTDESAAQNILNQANSYSKAIADGGWDEATLLQEWLQDINISRPVPSGIQRYKDKLKSRHA